MTLAPPPIICFGEILWDVLPDRRFLAGAPLNVACHLHQWGHKVYMLSAVGQDEAGQQAMEKLRSAGMRDDGIYQHPELPTSTVEVTLDLAGNASYTIHEPVAWDELVLTESLQKLLTPEFTLVYGTLALRNPHNRKLLEKLITRYSPTLCLDVNLRPPYDDLGPLNSLIAQAGFLKMNEQELLRLTHSLSGTISLKSRIEWLSQHYRCQRICVTLGEKGALYLRKGQWIEGTTPPVRVVDTIGAGDAFMASMVDALIHNTDGEPDSVLNACAHGARIASQQGAQNLF